MKLIFLGTPAFAVPTLKRLVRTHHEIAAVITQPDRPRGRGMELSPSMIKLAAIELDLPLMQPENASSPPVLDDIAGLKPDAAAVIAYGQILKKDFLDLPALGCINLHPSLLPRHRGPTPIQSSILAGEQQTGVTTILLDEGMDTGDILLQRPVDISDDDTAGTLHDRLAEVGADLVIETLEAMENHSVTPRKQDESKATFTQKLHKKDSVVDWNRSPQEICNHRRAMDPSPGCRTTLDNNVLKLWKLEPCEQTSTRARPGEILRVKSDCLVVQAGGGTVRILELQLAGKKRMSVEEFFRGHEIQEGTLLGD